MQGSRMCVGWKVRVRAEGRMGGSMHKGTYLESLFDFLEHCAGTWKGSVRPLRKLR